MASPEFQVIIQQTKENPFPLEVEASRERMEQIGEAFPPPEEVKIEAFSLEGLPAEWLTPPGFKGKRTLLYFHGGGFVAGSLNSSRNLAAHIALAGDIRVLNVEYRLAPENPYPAAVEDALTAYRWLLDQGVVPGKIAVGGDSAGGGLALGLMHWLRKGKHPFPGALALMSPATDATFSGDSFKENEESDILFEKEHLTRFLKAYLGAHPPDDPLASPLFGNFDGFPPMLIQVSQVEMLRDDSTQVAEKAKAAGVDVTLEIWEEMTHVWQYYVSFLPEAKEAVKNMGTFLKNKLP